MGDIGVDIFLETLKNLTTSSNPNSIKHPLRSLVDDIKYLREFLKITEKKRDEHSELMNLVMCIRDVVSEAENIIELILCRVFKANHAEPESSVPRYDWDHLLDLEHFLLEHQDLFLDLERVKKDIKTITTEVEQIRKENRYAINEATVKKLEHFSTGNSGSSGRSETSSVIVGFDEEIKKLMGKLHDTEKGPLEIISIIGAGGAGKTTLAREVYDRPLTSEKFEIRAWVVVSQDYDKTMKRDMLISILKSASQEKYEDYAESGEDILGEKVHRCLRGRKYLIVMDDIWSVDAWNDIQRSFPKECKGSKVLFSCRQLVQPDNILYVPHYLGPLPKTCSWKLLQKKIFEEKCCPPELESIGKLIAERCGGLPLAIVTIAGILAAEDKKLEVWEKVAKNLSSTIAENQEGCMEILELSYKYLPLHLKACFLYIGSHPEDSKIKMRELIWLWIAEGFIQQSKEGKSLEAIAKDYLIDLIERNLVLVAKENTSGIKECSVHDLLRELCWKKAKEDNFIVRIFENDSFLHSAESKHRCVFIGHQFVHKFFLRPHAPNLRSFRFPNSPKVSYGDYNHYGLSFFIENFELLRVLDTSAAGLEQIQKGDLVHLRYLGLYLGFHHLSFDKPQILNYLLNLETINILTQYTTLSLPRDIVKMVKLRHLHSSNGKFVYHVSDEEDEGYMLDGLQTLNRLCGCDNCRRLLKRTPNLRKLRLESAYKKLVILNLEFLKCLETLSIYESGPPVAQLTLPRTLMRLSLFNTTLKWKDLSIILQTLPSLEVLKVSFYACLGPIWDTSEIEEEFSQLKFLKFKNLNIEDWNVSEDQFPRLEVLVIENCERLTGIPIEFANLNELNYIKVEGSSKSAYESAKNIQEERRNTKGDDDCLNLVVIDNHADNHAVVYDDDWINPVVIDNHADNHAVVYDDKWPNLDDDDKWPNLDDDAKWPNLDEFWQNLDDDDEGHFACQWIKDFSASIVLWFRLCKLRFRRWFRRCKLWFRRCKLCKLHIFKVDPYDATKKFREARRERRW